MSRRPALRRAPWMALAVAVAVALAGCKDEVEASPPPPAPSGVVPEAARDARGYVVPALPPKPRPPAVRE